MIRDWDDRELEPVLLHELAHIKHCDLLINLLQVVIQIVYFFHPLVWYSNRLIRKRREEICDDSALSQLSVDRMNYIQGILRVMTESMKKPTPGLIRIALIQTKHSIRERIKRIMNKNDVNSKPLAIWSIAVLLLIACLSVTLSFAEKSDITLKKNGVALLKKGNVAQDFSLSQNFPNPVTKSTTTFPFTVPRKCTVSLIVYDKEGNEVANLVEKTLDAGEYQIEWKDVPASTGVYFYRLIAGDFENVKKMTVL